MRKIVSGIFNEIQSKPNSSTSLKPKCSEVISIKSTDEASSTDELYDDGDQHRVEQESVHSVEIPNPRDNDMSEVSPASLSFGSDPDSSKSASRAPEIPNSPRAIVRFYRWRLQTKLELMETTTELKELETLYRECLKKFQDIAYNLHGALQREKIHKDMLRKVLPGSLQDTLDFKMKPRSIKLMMRAVKDKNLKHTRTGECKGSRFTPQSELDTAWTMLRGRVSGKRLHDCHRAAWQVFCVVYAISYLIHIQYLFTPLSIHFECISGVH
jgi:hypothetical protein